MSVKITLATPFQRFTSGRETVFYAEGTFSEIMSGLAALYPGLMAMIMEKDMLKGHIVCLVNDKDIETLQGVDTFIKDGDELVILPVIAGG